jgi:CRISPR-associated endonuclease/helicase Cas3
LFRAATDHRPFDYQRRLGGGEIGAACHSKLINIPTGLGKTAAVVIAWLWNRVAHPDSAHRAAWPRRLVYCLPMRTLVEQVRDNARKWLENLSKTHPENADLKWLRGHSPVVLMGGEELGHYWDLYPERPAILIGTQDMLLSRALNRGYGMSRHRWPMQFGLLNRDSLWVMDETQLMGVGVETSAQLDGFRKDVRRGNDEPSLTIPANCFTWWMSATLDESRLATVDNSKPAGGWPTVKLENHDLENDNVRKRREAKKKLAASDVILSSSTKKAYARDLAKFVNGHHQRGQLTLVIVNQVPRSQELFEALGKLKLSARLALVHSRFRPEDRAKQQTILTQNGDRIVVATQAVEAGVDVSARVLITELAPWSALVQRFGRCNRAGEFSDGADVLWIDVAFDDDKEKRPYTVAELKTARTALIKMKDVGSASLTKTQVQERPVIRPVLRRKDLLDLFDATPDLAGHDLDISRYIRDGDDSDVQVFWREVPTGGPTADTPAAIRAELCRVSLPRFRDFLKKLNEAGRDRSAWIWNQLEGKWEQARAVRAGATYFLDHRAGGYDPLLGWTGKIADLRNPAEWVAPLPLPVKAEPPTAFAGNESSLADTPVTLPDHTRHVVSEAQIIMSSLLLPPAIVEALSVAATWHDVGKAFPEFQKLLRGENTIVTELLAKSGQTKRGKLAPPRQFFRHELPSALAWLAHGRVKNVLPMEAEICRNLIAYLIAAHHGRVRLSLRSLPGEEPPPDHQDKRIARGVMDGDELPAVELEGVSIPPTKLDLSLMEIGQGPQGLSWLARMLALRDRIGSFQLAFLETLLRAADMRASAAETQLATQP